MTRTAPFALLLLAALPVLGGEPYLVKDINPRSTPLSSEPRFLGKAGGRAILEAFEESAGWEIWASDGTAAGTLRLADICAGECSSAPRLEGQTDRLLFFSAYSPYGSVGFSTLDLWVTDGTPAGTLRLTADPTRLLPRGSFFPQPKAAGASLFYFVADDSIHGEELWRSDGTPAGTYQITDLRPGADSLRLNDIVTLGDRAIFTANDGRGTSLWASDGTAGGTRLLLAPFPSPVFRGTPFSLTRVGLRVFFKSFSERNRSEIWRTDGTAGGTARVADLVHGNGSFQHLITVFTTGRMGDRYLFLASSPKLGQELWISNGTKAGTYPLTNFRNAEPFGATTSTSFPRLHSVDLGSRALFLANDGEHGLEVWSSEGRPAAARLVKDLCVGSCSGAIHLFARGTSGTGLFRGRDSAHGEELWASDGTVSGTRLAVDVCPGSCSSDSFDAEPVGARFIFTSLLGDDDVSLWSWNPATSSGARLRSLGFGQDPLRFERFMPFGKRLLFAASSPELGEELWISNLTPAGTRLVRDIEPLSTGASSSPSQVMKLGSGMLFFASEEELGPASFWRSDGTLEGTVPIVEESALSPALSDRFTPVEAGGRLFFLAETPAGNTTLWRSDATTSGTLSLTPDEPMIRPIPFFPPAAAGDRLLFSATTVGEGEEPWVSDGTPGGTGLLLDLEAGSSSSSPAGFTSYQGKVYFSAFTNGPGRELWVSDGTIAGTRVLADLTPQLFVGSEPFGLVVHGGFLYFSARSSPANQRLWRTNGSEAGTVAVFDPVNVPGLQQVEPLASALGRLVLKLDLGEEGRWLALSDGTPGGIVRLMSLPFFDSIQALAGAEGRVFFTLEPLDELWVTDGTAGGTHAVLDFQGIPVTEAKKLKAVGGKAVFVGGTGRAWSSDGTPGGTRPVGPSLFRGFSELIVVGNRAFGSYWDLRTGVELWGVEP